MARNLEYISKETLLNIAERLFYDDAGGMPILAVPVSLIRELKCIQLPDKGKYATILTRSEWIVGGNWAYKDKVISRQGIDIDQVDQWKNLLETDDKSVFDQIEKGNNDPKIMILWKMRLVRTDEDGDEETVASSSIWESELR